jgi:hypothetical protein
MKKFLLISCFLVGITTICRAQGRPQLSPEDRLRSMQASIPDITPNQSVKILAIFKAEATKVDSIRYFQGDPSGLRKIVQAANESVNAILTPDQAAKWQRKIDAARQSRGGGN